MSFVKENEIKLIKAHVMVHKDVSKGTKELFEIADYDPNRDRYSVGNFTASDLSKTVYLPVFKCYCANDSTKKGRNFSRSQRFRRNK